MTTTKIDSTEKTVRQLAAIDATEVEIMLREALEHLDTAETWALYGDNPDEVTRSASEARRRIVQSLWTVEGMAKNVTDEFVELVGRAGATCDG